LLNIKEKTYKLDNLLKTFIMLSRIENKIAKIEKKEIDFKKYIIDLVNTFLLNYNKKIKIKYDLLPNLKLKIEESTFNVLFENLLSNAIKFSKNEIQIEI